MRRRLRVHESVPVVAGRSGATGLPSIQRDGPLTLNAPSLGQPADPAAKYRLGGNLKLELDPKLQAAIWQQIDQELDVTKVRPALGKVSYLGPGFPKLPVPAGANPPGSSGSGTAPPVNPFSLPAIPEPAPLVPKGAGPDKPKAGELSDIAEAVAAVPAVDQAITGLKEQAKAKVLTDWTRLSAGEKAITVTSLAVIGAGAIAGIATDPDARKLALGQLNGKVVPVPKVPWMRVEVNTGGDNLMVGIHVDVGSLLPPALGFGPSSPNPIGGAPEPAQREAAANGAPTSQNQSDGPDSEGLGRRIKSLAGGGIPLPDEIEARFSSPLGADLSGVRVHTDQEADHLARVLDARAFTSGSDIYFRAGEYQPRSSEGLRLLAHETVHAVQQAEGAVAGNMVRGGVLVSDPTDAFEREAAWKAKHLARSF